VSLPDEAVVINGDPVRLAQVLVNLLNNAIKFTPPGGHIWLIAERTGELPERPNQVRIRVRDTGIGISQEAQGRIFQAFVQADGSTTRKYGGTGLGLAISRQLVELMHGEIGFESTPGKGSTFWFTVPLEIQSEQQPPRGIATTLEGFRILVVDDNADAADSLAEVVRSMGHHAEVAYSGLTALQIAADGRFDLVMLDIGMPGMDGYEVARRLRRIVGPATHIVAVTGYGAEEDRRRSREAGFDDHVVKPMMPQTLSWILARPRAPAPHDAPA
jgi:CheY-like chemotaxis protein